MKALSLRAKITLYFTAALLLMALFSLVLILAVSNQILQKTVKDSLIETVENNYNDITFHATLEGVDSSATHSHYLPLTQGFLEVSEDFLDVVNQVYTALYARDGTFFYGENPLLDATRSLSFGNGRIQTLTVEGVRYYVFDRRLEGTGLDGFWMRGIVAETQGRTQMDAITRVSLIITPLFLLLAVLGGYFLVRRMLKPIQNISEAARSIGQDGDLSRRIPLPGNKDELWYLADTFNSTFDQLERSFASQRQFIADASHELRTPMAVISAQCELSLSSPQTAEEYEKALTVIDRQGKKVSRLVEEMLDFARLESGGARYPKERLDLSALIVSLCEDLSLIGEKNIVLTCEAERDISFVGNAPLLSRLLTNLVTNAYRYGKENGHIFVTLAKKDEAILLSVTDDGIGIAPEEQEKIFARFYQVEKARTGAGLGLGLPMAREIARFHGGSLTVESVPGLGSRFTARFGG